MKDQPLRHATIDEVAADPIQREANKTPVTAAPRRHLTEDPGHLTEDEFEGALRRCKAKPECKRKMEMACSRGFSPACDYLKR